MLSEAAHSATDLVASAITLFSIQVADRPADDDHNYGHGKVESLSAFVETGLMLASSLWIIYEAVHRLLFRNHLTLPISPWPFLVLGLSIAVDITRSRALRRAAVTHRSEALAADAAHFATDIWASIAVLLGLTATALGEHFHLPQLQLADPLAALAVSALILTVSWRLARHTLDTLLDATPADSEAGHSSSDIRRKLIHDLAHIPGVLSVDRLRTRRAGTGYFADLTLAMPRNLTFQRSEQITLAATAAVQRILPLADVVVHSVPTATLAESVHDRVRAVAARANLSVHDLSVKQHLGALNLELHLEVNETLPLRAAHDLVTRLEANIRAEIPNVASILTHIESEPATIERPTLLATDEAEAQTRRLTEVLRHVALAFPQILDIHDVIVSRPPHAAYPDRRPSVEVTCHCTLPDALPMSEVHTLLTALENAFKLQVPEATRLLIHPEPATDNRR